MSMCHCDANNDLIDLALLSHVMHNVQYTQVNTEHLTNRDGSDTIKSMLALGKSNKE